MTSSIATAAVAGDATSAATGEHSPSSSRPSIRTLPTSRRTLLVDRLFVDRRPEAYRLTSAAAARGDNVGVDEFPTAADFDEFLDDCSTVLALCDPTTNRLEGLILISPCRYVTSAASVRLCAPSTSSPTKCCRRGPFGASSSRSPRMLPGLPAAAVSAPVWPTCLSSARNGCWRWGRPGSSLLPACRTPGNWPVTMVTPATTWCTRILASGNERWDKDRIYWVIIPLRPVSDLLVNVWINFHHVI